MAEIAPRSCTRTSRATSFGCCPSSGWGIGGGLDPALAAPLDATERQLVRVYDRLLREDEHERKRVQQWREQKQADEERAT